MYKKKIISDSKQIRSRKILSESKKKNLPNSNLYVNRRRLVSNNLVYRLSVPFVVVVVVNCRQDTKFVFFKDSNQVKKNEYDDDDKHFKDVCILNILNCGFSLPILE